MNNRNLVNLEKPFSELCVLSEDEKTFQGTLQWNIPKAEIPKNLKFGGKSVSSDWFSIGSPSYCSFYFLFYPSGKDCNSEKCVSISIIFNRKLPDSAWVKGELHFGGIEHAKSFSVSGKDFEKKIELDIVDYYYGLDIADYYYGHHKIKLYPLFEEIDWDFIMYCSIKISLREIQCAFDKEKTFYAESRNYNSSKETINHNSFSDVSIIINDHQFETHKTVLAQIPYFQELFDANESVQSFELTDIEHEIFEHILTFMYSGDIPRLSFKLACELYIVANDLNIFDLKNLCSSYLGANLTETNAVMVLKISNECEDVALKRECFKFIKKSDVEILTTQSIVL